MTSKTQLGKRGCLMCGGRGTCELDTYPATVPCPCLKKLTEKMTEDEADDLYHAAWMLCE